jgi:hypothetical protein
MFHGYGPQVLLLLIHLVRRCKLTLSNLTQNRTWVQRLKLECDELLSSFGFNFNLRHYNLETAGLLQRKESTPKGGFAVGTGKYRSSRHWIPFRSRNDVDHVMNDVAGNTSALFKYSSEPAMHRSGSSGLCAKRLSAILGGFGRFWAILT